MTVETPPDLDAQPIDELAVNTIRVLAMDAVQAANSGHPGTPMALAPVGYTLWTRYLRFDPELPVWANRDRFVLSAGHASTLLYALLHLAEVKSVNPDYEIVGTPRSRWTTSSGSVSSTRSAPAPGVPLDVRGRVHHRAAGHRDRDQRGHGDRRAVAGRHVQPPRLRPVRLRRLRDRRRRLPDGGHRRGGGLAGRAPRSWRTCAGSTTTTGSPSRARRAWRSARTCRPGSPGSAGPCSTSPTPTISPPWARRSRRSRPRPSGPR